MPNTKIFEQLQSGGTAAFLITTSKEINIGDSGDLSDGTVNSAVCITKLHWSGEVQIEDKGGISPDIDFTLSGNGAWSQFNGWTPVDCTGNLKITITTGSLFIEIKKLAGFPGRSDYSA